MTDSVNRPPWNQGTGGPPELAVVDEDTKLVDVVAIMLRESVESVAVQNNQDKIIGVLSKDEIFTLVVRGAVLLFMAVCSMGTSPRACRF